MVNNKIERKSIEIGRVGGKLIGMTCSTLLLAKIKKKKNQYIDKLPHCGQATIFFFFFTVKYKHETVKDYLIDDQLN